MHDFASRLSAPDRGYARRPRIERQTDMPSRPPGREGVSGIDAGGEIGHSARGEPVRRT